MENDIEKLLERILLLVERPARYIGGEVGSIKKEWSNESLKFLLAYPEPYELSAGHTGGQILYHIINREPDLICERAYLPWIDMADLMRKKGIPIFSLESKRAAAEFDVIGFSVHYELSYTNIFEFLDLARIPFYANERDETFPLIIGGGSFAFQPEPVAELFDIIIVGDAEELIVPVLRIIKGFPRTNREEYFKELAKLDGIYIPRYYRTLYEDGKIVEIRSNNGFPLPVKASCVKELKSSNYPEKPIVPWIELVHDRMNVEIMRGCGRGCRFCEPGFIYRPVREREPSEIIKNSIDEYGNTGFEEINLLSLSTADYSRLDLLLSLFNEKFVSQRNVSIAFPSIKPDSLDEWALKVLHDVKKSGLTFAPEAGTERLRRVINKPLDEERFIEIVQKAYELGWRSFKLYFMIGLPKETEADIDGIISLVKRIQRAAPKSAIKLTISPFVPKPHTPFQWERMDSFENIRYKMAKIKSELSSPDISFDRRDIYSSFVEAALARGDRRLTRLLENVWRNGGRYAGWQDMFDFKLWEKNARELGLELEIYTREYSEDERLPWDHIYKIPKSYLLHERHKAYKDELTEDCRARECENCKICPTPIILAHKLQTQHIFVPSYGYGRSKRKVSSGGMRVSFGKKWRFRFEKCMHVRFLSHLDTFRVIERAIRRAGWNVEFTEGFTKRMKLSLGPPLPLGYISRAEYFDLEFKIPPSDSQIERLNESLPEGFKILEYMPIVGKIDSLFSAIDVAHYIIHLPKDICISGNDLLSILNMDSIIIKRREKEIDIRPLILKLNLISPSKISALLRISEKRTARPDEILLSMGFERERIAETIFERTELLKEEYDGFYTPMGKLWEINNYA